MTFSSAVRAIVISFIVAVSAAAPRASFADEPQALPIPQTVADHEALAKQYREQAAQYRKVAADHRAMAAAYAKTHLDMKTIKNPWNEKMQKHCKVLAADAERLAADADKAADFHSFRAKELQGK